MFVVPILWKIIPRLKVITSFPETSTHMEGVRMVVLGFKLSPYSNSHCLVGIDLPPKSITPVTGGGQKIE